MTHPTEKPKRLDRRRRSGNRKATAVEAKPKQTAPTLCDALDRVLHTGVSAQGEVVIAVAGIDLIYLRLGALLASVETARRVLTDEGVSAEQIGESCGAKAHGRTP